MLDAVARFRLCPCCLGTQQRARAGERKGCWFSLDARLPRGRSTSQKSLLAGVMIRDRSNIEAIGTRLRHGQLHPRSLRKDGLCRLGPGSLGGDAGPSANRRPGPPSLDLRTGRTHRIGRGAVRLDVLRRCGPPLRQPVPSLGFLMPGRSTGRSLPAGLSTPRSRPCERVGTFTSRYLLLWAHKAWYIFKILSSTVE